jgi:cell division protein FtsQ
MNSALYPSDLPVDVRLMNKASAALLVLALLAAMVVAGWWVLRNPVFAVKRITVVGDTSHNSVATLRAHVTPKMVGNFYTLDLAQTRTAFEAVPWVRKATVRREFPDRLKVTVQEHQAVAYWGNEDEPRLVNSFGEVFEANVGDIEQDDLPHLKGPEKQSVQVLAMYRLLKTPFELLEAGLDELELTPRGGWRAQLDSGAVLELGSGTADEVLRRTQRFVRTLTQVSAKYGRQADALLAADLRYPEGYALRLRGVGTVTTDAPVTPIKIQRQSKNVTHGCSGHACSVTTTAPKKTQVNR